MTTFLMPILIYNFLLFESILAATFAYLPNRNRTVHYNYYKSSSPATAPAAQYRHQPAAISGQKRNPQQQGDLTTLPRLFAFTLPLFVPMRDCPDGWTLFRTFCYKLFNEEVTQATAQQRCSEQKAHLVSVHSAEENNFIKELAIISRPPVAGEFWHWLGMELILGVKEHNIQAEIIESRWLDGTPVDFGDPKIYGGRDPWVVGEPTDFDGGIGRSCVILVQGQWMDVSCDLYGGFVCKN